MFFKYFWKCIYLCAGVHAWVCACVHMSGKEGSLRRKATKKALRSDQLPGRALEQSHLERTLNLLNCLWAAQCTPSSQLLWAVTHVGWACGMLLSLSNFCSCYLFPIFSLSNLKQNSLVHQVRLWKYLYFGLLGVPYLGCYVSSGKVLLYNHHNPGPGSWGNPGSLVSETIGLWTLPWQGWVGHRDVQAFLIGPL